MKAHQQLDFSSLRKALDALKRAQVRSASAKHDEELRDACIQRFEFSFELSWKMIKRRLERDLASADQLDGMSFKELMRTAFEAGLIHEVQAWWLYREMRNLSSHTYDAQIAVQVHSVIEGFIGECDFLITQLERKGLADA